MANELNSNKKTMSSLEIAELAGRNHKDVMRSIRDMEPAWVKEGGRNFALTSYVDQWNRQQPCYELDYKECMYIASKFEDATRAKLVLRWDALETGKAKPMIYQSKIKREPTLTTKIRVSLEWIKGVSEMLNLNDASKLALLGKVAEPLNLPLPDYTPSKGILKSATDLLKERKTQISAREFNTVAIEKGYLCELERKSSYGQKKKFKSITEKGLSFGENQVNPNNPKGTQPLWYESKFDELLAVLGFHFIGETN